MHRICNLQNTNIREKLKIKVASAVFPYNYSVLERKALVMETQSIHYTFKDL